MIDRGKLWIAAAVALTCSASASFTLAGSLPRFPRGTPYAEARKSLKALGYHPNVLPDSDAVSRGRCGYKPDSLVEPKPGAGDDDTRCFPEMIACAGTGLGQCIYSWRHGETLIDVFTTNEIPGVSGVACRVNC